MIFLDLYKLGCHNRMEGYGNLSLACLLFSKFILASDWLSQLVGSIYISNTFYFIYIYIFPCEICDIILKEDLLNSSSVQFSHSVMSNSLRPHGLQHAMLPSPSPTPRAYSNSCPSHRWCISNCLTLCHPLLILPSIFPSIRVFSNEAVLHIRWSKYWSFSFSISLSNEYWGLISFRIY